MANHPVVTLWIYRLIKKRAKGRRIIPYEYVLEAIKRILHKVPHSLHYQIIKEMEELRLVKRINKTKYEITGKNADNVLNKFNVPF